MAREDGLAGRAGERKRTREGVLEEIFPLNHSLPFNIYIPLVNLSCSKSIFCLKCQSLDISRHHNYG
jgi:hypothetical protein